MLRPSAWHCTTGGAVADDSGDKTEDPTPKKLQEARDEGQVAYSPEVSTAVLLLGGAIILLFQGPALYAGCADVFRLCMGRGLLTEVTDGSLMGILAGVWAPVIGPLAIITCLLAVLGLSSSILQVGLHASSKAITPKFTRLNPMAGLGRLFGVRGLMRFAVNLLKLVVIVAVAYVVLRGRILEGLHADLDVGRRLAHEAWILWSLFLTLALVLAAIALLDLLYQRWQHHRDLMMTKQEVKEEYRQSEGDPLVKSKIRQVQRQMAQRRMMQEVPKADVVITNPTHVAVALRYDPAEMASPVVVAKGYDAVAQRIKAIAAEHGVTQVENIELARALARKVEIGHPIPTEFFTAVAEILAFVYRLRGRKADGRT
jgi:flagellar biosynthetic protein FlhB